MFFDLSLPLQLLSPFNRWSKLVEGKSVLALARSNRTMRKVLVFWMNFYTPLHSGHLKLCLSSSLLSPVLLRFFGSSRRNMSHLFHIPSLQTCGRWSATGPRLEHRDKTITAVSAQRKRIRLPQIWPLQILTRQMCEAGDGEDFCELAARSFSRRSRSAALLEAAADKEKQQKEACVDFTLSRW